MAKKTIKSVPAVLAFEKKLVPSDGYLSGTTWVNRYYSSIPLAINSKSVRGTISNRLDKKLLDDLDKLNHAIENPNPQEVDSCSLGVDQDTLKIQFSLKVLGNVGNPSACNDSDFQKSLVQLSQEYAKQYGFAELGKRYALSLATGRFFWRNRIGAEKLEIHVRDMINTKDWIFDGYQYSIKHFDCDDSKVNELGNVIGSALADPKGLLLLEIEAYAKIGKSQEVYPSEEMVLGKMRDQNEKSKILYSVDGQAALHSQKIGNAIRTIDSWYPSFAESGVGPIPIEIYGAVTTLGTAFRNPGTKSDFYSLFDSYVLGEKDLSEDEKHYVMAVLIRGGVFGASSKE